jgi:hypothetical protein
LPFRSAASMAHCGDHPASEVTNTAASIEGSTSKGDSTYPPQQLQTLLSEHQSTFENITYRNEEGTILMGHSSQDDVPVGGTIQLANLPGEGAHNFRHSIESEQGDALFRSKKAISERVSDTPATTCRRLQSIQRAGSNSR